MLNQEQLTFLKEIHHPKGNLEKLTCYETLIEARVNGELIGLAGTVKRHHIINSLFLVVKQEHRGQGIGSNLFKQLWASKKQKPWLTVYKDNFVALKLYKNYYYFIPYFHGKLLGIPRRNKK